MMLQEFEKKHDFLICVDSDGCAMDTMDIKHFRCFGPCMVEEWALEEWAQPILDRWNEVNLYTMTRGINRFKGLALALREIDEKYKRIDGVDELENWVATAPALSNDGVKAAIEAGGGEVFRKALSWSVKVNESINALPFDVKKPFDGVLERLKYAHGVADIAIVSSANLQAVEEEWALLRSAGSCGHPAGPEHRQQGILYCRAAEKGLRPGQGAHDRRRSWRSGRGKGQRRVLLPHSGAP